MGSRSVAPEHLGVERVARTGERRGTPGAERAALRARLEGAGGLAEAPSASHTATPATWAPWAPPAWESWVDPARCAETEGDTQTIQRTTLLPPYNVILLDDDDHTYEYVVEMLRAVFGMSPERAYLHACEVDASKRTIVLTTTKEHAELKVEQIESYGKDPRLPRCSGSMSAIIEPAN